MKVTTRTPALQVKVPLAEVPDFTVVLCYGRYYYKTTIAGLNQGLPFAVSLDTRDCWLSIEADVVPMPDAVLTVKPL